MQSKISTGIWFIFIGVIILLHNLNIINFNFWAILPYWPILVIALGAKLIFQNRKNGNQILIGINIALCIFLGFIGLTSSDRFNLMSVFTVNNPQDTTGASPTIQSPFLDNMKTAKLELNLGAVAVNIDNVPSEDLLHAQTANNNLVLKLTKSGEDNNPHLSLSSIIKNNNEKNNKITVALNENPIWDMEINIGAVSFNGNLSRYKFSDLEINAGASSMNITLGLPAVETSKIEINTAASSCAINIPNDAACRVETTTILSSKKLPGFIKVDDYYQTSNYETATNKYNITLDGAANSLKINRY